MALADCGFTVWPLPLAQGGSTTLGLFQLTTAFDSATDRVAYIGRSPLTDSLATVHLRLATVTTGCTINVRIETVSNGRPTGTLWATDTSATVVIADTDDNAWKTATLTAAASLTRGAEFAIVITVNAGTPNLQFVNVPTGTSTGMGFGQYPLMLQDTGAGSWTVITGGWGWICSFSGAGIAYMPGLSPASGAGTVNSFNSGSSPDERALRFQVPFACRSAGARVPIFNLAAGADFTISLWDATGDVDGEALAQISVDGDFPLNTTQDGYVDVFWPSAVTLSANTTYYLGVRADTANSLGTGDLSNSIVSNAMRAFGVNDQTYLATRTWTAGAAGAWSTTTTTLMLAHIIIDQLDNGAGGGSASSVANLRGNMQ